MAEPSISFEADMIIYFDYINYKGEHERRRVRISEIRYGRNGWHPEQQWLMKGYDYARKEDREFSMKDMSNVDMPMLG